MVVSKYKTNKDFIKIVVYFDDTISSSCLFYILKQPRCLSSEFVLYYNTGAIHVKMDGSVLSKNHLLKCLDWPSLLNRRGALTLSLLLKLPPRKLEPWLVHLSLFLLGLIYISINLPYAHAWNTFIKSGLVPLVVTWNF